MHEFTLNGQFTGSVTPADDIMTLLQSGSVPPLEVPSEPVSLDKSPEHIEKCELQAEVRRLKAQVVDMQRSVEEKAGTLAEAHYNHRRFQEQVRDVFKTMVEEGDLDMDSANDILVDSLGLEKLTRTYKTTVLVEIEIEGLEAPDGREIDEDTIRYHLDVTADFSGGLKVDYTSFSVERVRDLEEE